MVFNARDLSKSQLPTVRDVIEYLLFLHKENVRSGASRNIGFADFFTKVIHEVRPLWQRLAIPLISDHSIRSKLKTIVKWYRGILKTPSKYVVGDWNKLFMLCQCRCVIELNADCNCSPAVRIPNDLKEFFLDQCRERFQTLDRIKDNASSVQVDEPMEMDSVESASVMMSEDVSQLPCSSAGYQPSQEELDEFMQNSGAFSPLEDPHPHLLKVSGINLQLFLQLWIAQTFLIVWVPS